MHERYQLGHFGHFYTFGHDRARGSADQQADHDVANPRAGAFCCRQGRQFEHQAYRGDDGQTHTEHAEQVAAAGGGRV